MSDHVEAEFVEEKTSALALQDTAAPVAPVGLFNTDDPALVISKAVKVADALMEIVKAKGWAKRIGPKDHLEIAAWQTIGAMLGVSAVCEWTRRTPESDGWESRVYVTNARGQTIAAAESQCTRSEKTWSGRDDYALRSMAQTRATSKALRMALGFIANIAGFSDTPADEMPDDKPRTSAPAPTGQVPVSELVSYFDQGKAKGKITDVSLGVWLMREFAHEGFKTGSKLTPEQSLKAKQKLQQILQTPAA